MSGTLTNFPANVKYYLTNNFSRRMVLFIKTEPTPESEMRIEIDGRSAEVQFLSGEPWYVMVRSGKTGFWRTIWHRANNRSMGELARLSILAAQAIN